MGAAAGGAAAGGAGALGGTAGAASAATPWLTMGLGAVNVLTDLAGAGAQVNAARSAERAAQDAAKKEELLRSQDLFQALQMPMEQYNRAGREVTSQVGQAVGALQEGDPRLLAGGIGKVAAAGIEGEADTRDAAAADLFKIGVAQAQSGMNVNANLADLEAERLKGAQTAQAAAKQAELAAYTGAANAGIGVLNTGLSMIPSFGSDGEAPVSGLQAVQPVQSVNMAPAQQLQNMSNSNIAAFNNKYQPIPSWMNSLSFLNKPQ
jgi:hypothetical protein